jgi:hypothetical protein
MQKLWGYIQDKMNTNEKFVNKEEFGYMLIMAIIIYIIVIVIILFIGKFLWNQILSKKISGLKPLESIWQFFGLWLLIQLLICC